MSDFNRVIRKQEGNLLCKVFYFCHWENSVLILCRVVIYNKGVGEHLPTHPPTLQKSVTRAPLVFSSFSGLLLIYCFMYCQILWHDNKCVSIYQNNISNILGVNKPFISRHQVPLTCRDRFPCSFLIHRRASPVCLFCMSICLPVRPSFCPSFRLSVTFHIFLLL